MNFTPKTAEETNNLLPKGNYTFTVEEAEEVTSKKGAPMIKMFVAILDDTGKVRSKLTTYLMEAMPAQLRHFADATGLLAHYERGSLTAKDCLGKTGKCKIIIKVDPTGTYDDQNNIADYISRDTLPIKSNDADDFF